MIDHLLLFPSRAAAGAALAPLGLTTEQDSTWTFAANICLNIGGPNDESMRVGLSRAVWDYSDPEHPVETTPEALLPGWYCLVATNALDTSIRDLPDNVCRLIADRERSGTEPADYLLYTAPDLTPETLAAVAFVEPTYAGSRHPFGVG